MTSDAFDPLNRATWSPAQLSAAKKYRIEYARRAQEMALLGADDEFIAKRFGVHVETLRRWEETFPEFAGELESGRLGADVKVARAALESATGYSHEAVKFFVNKTKDEDGNVTTEILPQPYVERFPPNVEALKFWLTNRRPDLWQVRTNTQFSGGIEVKGGGLAGLLEATNAAKAQGEPSAEAPPTAD